jgi:hypothetical protein
MIHSIDAEKAFNKIQHPFMIKALKKLELEGTFLNIIVSKYYTKWRTTETIPAKVRNKTGMPALSIPIQCSFEIPSQGTKTRARNKKRFKQGRKKSNYPYLQMT